MRYNSKNISFTVDVYDPKVDVIAIREVVNPNGDELLRIISNVSPRTIRKFSFGYKWISQQKGWNHFLRVGNTKKDFQLNLRVITNTMNPRVDAVATREVVDPNKDKLLMIISNVSPKLYEYFHLDTNGISQQKS
ncbi:hypothetical protein RhiirA4_456117 [Rhizophagus irregularis]|uniref:Uncharacterized protein n=1 Tax=Rhizophagus irregularis TaxID=588596 RepID=A0A2I1G6S8_9GLOM|nr:hypothetical protein RhiirA4_456117 [Rhizophagus irregularis]